MRVNIVQAQDWRFLLVLIGDIAMFFVIGGECRSSEEKSLIKYLLYKHENHNSSTVGRPIENASQPLNVEFGVTLIQILRVDEYAGQLVSNMWTNFKWNDPFMGWNVTEWGGINMVRVPPDRVWTPDVSLFNYADTRPQQHRNTLVVVYAGGKLNWIPTGIFKSVCSVNTYSFPFDEQICSMTFTSLSYGIDYMTLSFIDGKSNVSLDSYVKNLEWEIIENVATRDFGYRGMKIPYHDLTFTLRLKRRSLFHRYLLLLPCVLLSLTAGVLFMLPPESPAKIQIGIFIFQGFFLLLNLLKNSTPPSGTSPTICSYYGSSMIATTFVVFACGFLVEIHFHADRKAPMSDRMRHIIIRTLAQWLFIPIPTKNPLELKRQQKNAKKEYILARRQTMLRRERIMGSPAIGARCATPLLTDGHFHTSSTTQFSQQNRSGTSSYGGESGLRRRLSSWGKSLLSVSRQRSVAISEEEAIGPDGMLGDLVELRKIFQRVADKQSMREYTELVRQEWLIAITVFDRIFFFSYLAYIVYSLYFLLPQEK